MKRNGISNSTALMWLLGLPFCIVVACVTR